MRYITISIFGLMMACTNVIISQKVQMPENLIPVLDTIWYTEQEPIRLRDSIMKIYGAKSTQFQEQQKIYKKNHVVNEQKVKNILDKYGWPTKEMIGEHGNWTICNVLQHLNSEVRLKYLPMMKQAVIDKKLEPRFLVRAEDRIATESGKLQIYGGQMKYYPETKRFNVWPVYDPVNIDKRRAEIGLGPIAEFLKQRFNFEWTLEEQNRRTEEFEIGRNKKKQVKKDSDIIIGKTLSIYSKILNEERRCFISLPGSYADSTSNKKYPLIILLDGNAFFETTLGIVHFMSSDRNGNHFMPESIVVAIENVDRERDFTVTKIKTERPNSMGGGRFFLEFIEKELIPYLDKNYRTDPFRTLVGHSLGGLLTLNSYMDKNSLFDAYISIDPSIWWNEEMMKTKVDSITRLSLNKKLYIATANQGVSNYERNKKRHDTLYDMLKKKSNGQLNVEIAYFKKENHRSVPLIAIYEGLKYIYNYE